jgi:type II secretory pathway pseudopilin PulG
MKHMMTLKLENARNGNRWNRPLVGARFTLIELLVVVAIVVLLAGFLMPVLTKSKARAVETKLMSNIRQIHLANLQYKAIFDEQYLINTLSGGKVGVDFEPLREHGYSEELSEDLFRVETLSDDITLQTMGLPLSLNDFHSSGRGLLYLNFHQSNPSTAVISRQMVSDKFNYNLPDDTTYAIIGVGINGKYDTGKPATDFVFLGRESNANIERWPNWQ